MLPRTMIKVSCRERVRGAGMGEQFLQRPASVCTSFAIVVVAVQQPKPS
jgi:hypothetical protein